MATYVYETIPQHADEIPQQFEMVQSMKDAALLRHPETGQPVRRVVLGGYGLISARNKSAPAAVSSKPPTTCGAGCACHSGPRIPPL